MNRLAAVAVLALVPMLAAGQGVQVDTTAMLIDEAGWSVAPMTIDRAVKVGHDHATSIYSDIREYEMECYADSTEKWVYAACPDDRFGCIVYHGHTLEWRHKTPTFADFINWINRKYPRP